MTNIRFHRIDNKDYPRYHGIWFRKFAKYCEQFFNVEWMDYATTTDQGNGEINLNTEIGQFGHTPPLCDVDCVIENLDTKQFVVLSFTEYFNSYVVHYLKSEFCQKVCVTHFSYRNIYDWLKRDRLTHKLDKVSPWFFGSYDEFDIDYYRNIRQNTPTLNDELFFKGSGIDGYRQAVKILHDKGIVDNSNLRFDMYFDKLATSKCALSYYMDLDKYYTAFHHPGEFCYRDMEYMSLGVPYIRIEYKDAVYNGLIPNHHYITIPREYAYVIYNQSGNEGVANLIEEKYYEVINDDALLNYISKNQIEWFDTYAKWPNSAKFTVKLTGMDTWI